MTNDNRAHPSDRAGGPADLSQQAVSAKGAHPLRMRLVIIESPYAGDIDANVTYARACMRDSLNRGEAPIASHLLYTQEGVLRDEIPDERQWGIDAGLAWRAVADLAAFYVDRDWSGGMLAARRLYRDEGFPYEVRLLNGDIIEYHAGEIAA